MPTSVALILCAFLAAISLPLALRLIGPNSLYGFRTPATLADRDLWYSANAFAGRALLVAAAFAASLVWFRPAWFDLGVFTNLAAVVLPCIGAVAVSFLYLRKYR
jgi:uncharacterized membrane protein